MNTISAPTPQLLLPAPKPQLLLPAPQPAPEPEPVATQPPDFVDVSHHQGEIDWKKYAASGHQLAVCKITEGGDFNDTKAQMFRAGMADAGLKTGIYHFARPNAANLLEDADLEAKHYLEQVGTLRPNEFPILDFEEYKGLNASQLTDWATRWCETVETSTGKTPWLYTNNRILHQVDATKLSKYPLWLADYRTSDHDNPPPAAPWPKLQAWQFTDKAEFPGLPGKVDGSYLYGSLPA
jgi:lysozyme